MSDIIFSFDIESVGLQGEAFAFGAVILDVDTGAEISNYYAACSSENAIGSMDGRKFITKHVDPVLTETHDTPREVRDYAWSLIQTYKEEGCVFVVDCGWPVEANFLSACVKDDIMRREMNGPYPLHELATLIHAKGGNPLDTNERLESELPAHHPTRDARQTARLWYEWSKK